RGRGSRRNLGRCPCMSGPRRSSRRRAATQCCRPPASSARPGRSRRLLPQAPCNITSALRPQRLDFAAAGGCLIPANSPDSVRPPADIRPVFFLERDGFPAGGECTRARESAPVVEVGPLVGVEGQEYVFPVPSALADGLAGGPCGVDAGDVPGELKSRVP